MVISAVTPFTDISTFSLRTVVYLIFYSDWTSLQATFCLPWVSFSKDKLHESWWDFQSLIDIVPLFHMNHLSLLCVIPHFLKIIFCFYLIASSVVGPLSFPIYFVALVTHFFQSNLLNTSFFPWYCSLGLLQALSPLIPTLCCRLPVFHRILYVVSWQRVHRSLIQLLPIIVVRHSLQIIGSS